MIVRNINPDIVALTAAQTQIKKLILDGYYKGKSFGVVAPLVKKVILGTEIINPEIASLKTLALMSFAGNVWVGLVKQLGGNGKAVYDKIQAIEEETDEMGVPNSIYSKIYMRKVAETMRKMSESEAYIDGYPLRSRAELETRYQYHLDEIEGFRASGTKLVVCSVHADCSGRCSPWQGKVYSLDKTSGKTEDGRDFQPLENATEIYYATKAGRVYKNGLLGFNCRHKLYEYKEGMGIPKVPKSVQRREYEVTQRQREMETRIRNKRDEYQMLKESGMTAEATKAHKKALSLTKKYIAFSKENERAFYPARLQILK